MAVGRREDWRRRRLRLMLKRDLDRPFDLVVHSRPEAAVSVRVVEGRLKVRLHRVFLDAVGEDYTALTKFLGSQGRSGRRTIEKFVERNAERIRTAEEARKARSRRELVSKGRHHHLGEIYRSLNDRYFGGRVDLAVTWGRDGRRQQVAGREIQLGAWDEGKHQIRIHPALDEPWVPRYYVEFVMYHEMLHADLGATVDDSGRRRVHTREFRLKERRYLLYERAILWEKMNIRQLLGGS